MQKNFLFYFQVVPRKLSHIKKSFGYAATFESLLSIFQITSDPEISTKNVSLLNLGKKMIHLRSNEKMPIGKTEDLFKLLRIIKTLYVKLEQNLRDCSQLIEALVFDFGILIRELKRYYTFESDLRLELYVKCLRISIGCLILLNFSLNLQSLSFESLNINKTLANLFLLRTKSKSRLKILEQLLEMEVSDVMTLCFHFCF